MGNASNLVTSIGQEVTQFENFSEIIQRKN